MTKSAEQLIQIVRNVTGRVDASDPLFTDPIILGYINDFYTLEMSQEVRLNEKMTWLEFNIGPFTDPPVDGVYTDNPLPIDLQNPPLDPLNPTVDPVALTTIGPLIYIEGFQCWWYQDPQQFYWRWPETQEYQPTRPTDVLYYNNTLTFRAPADRVYRVKINAYAVETEMEPNGYINQDYLWRYICYGAARDIFSDYGELDQWERYAAAFVRYKALVYARTYQQNMNQRSLPRF